MLKKTYYTWLQFDNDIKKMSEKIKKSGRNFDGVWGPVRGGLVPAVMLSHALSLPFLDRPTGKTLVVDDIADTGKTLKEFYRKNFITTFYYHRQSIVVPDIWLREKKDQWIVFPWERDSS